MVDNLPLVCLKIYLTTNGKHLLEAYHKKMKNLIEYKEGVFPEDNTNTSSDNSFTFGTGDSYGLEFFIKKRLGKTTGWLGYTISKTT